jgi:rod shape-determining protein MreD
MKNLIAVFIVLILVFVQVTFLHSLEVIGLKPELLLVGTIFFSMKMGAVPGFAIGAFSGFIFDCLSLSPLGLHTFLYGLAGLLSGRARKKVYYEGFPAQMLVVFSASLAVSIVYLAAGATGPFPLPFFFSLGRVALPSALYTMLIAPPLFFILFRLTRISKY